jgi:hypothetical protein
MGQMLANAGHGITMHTTSLVDDSTLCSKKDVIISKFDQLLKKLGGEVCAQNSNTHCPRKHQI